LPRKKKETETTPIPSPILNIKDIDINNPPSPNTQVEIDAEYMNNFQQQYAISLKQTINQLNALNDRGFYNPQQGQDYIQSVNISPLVPTQTQLTEWLKNPSRNQKALRDVSQFLDGAIMQYKRSIKHFASILTYRYDLRPLSKLPKDADSKKEYLSSMDTCNNLLRKLNVKYQMEKMVWDVMQSGVAYYYIKDTPNFRTLYPLPRDFCYITGNWDYGYTIALDLTFFDKAVGLGEVVPEFYEAYKFFIQMRELGVAGDRLKRFQYYPVPVENSYVFTFDPLHADTSPPLKGVFKDAFEILSYKDLLKQKTILDTVTLLFQQIPYDTDSKKFIMEYNEASKIVSATQALLPKGVRTLASPFKGEQFNFSQNQSMNNINGMGESLYWSSVGVNATLMGGETKSALVLKYSIEGDYGFVDHLYRQIENFINWQLMLISRKYNWSVKFYGNRYTEAEDIDRELKIVTSSNAGIEKLYALRGFEPFEIDPVLDLEKELDRKSKLLPIISGNQMSGKDVDNKGGAPEKTNLTEGGENQKTYDSNANNLKT
jgi:hypothetical protein